MNNVDLFFFALFAATFVLVAVYNAALFFKAFSSSRDGGAEFARATIAMNRMAGKWQLLFLLVGLMFDYLLLGIGLPSTAAMCLLLQVSVLVLTNVCMFATSRSRSLSYYR